jgi:hypothetical protein
VVDAAEAVVEERFAIESTADATRPRSAEWAVEAEGAALVSALALPTSIVDRISAPMSDDGACARPGDDAENDGDAARLLELEWPALLALDRCR